MAGLVEIVADPMETGAYRQRSQVGGGCFGAAFGCGVFHHAVEYHAQGAQIGDGAAAVVFVVKTRRVVAGNRRQVADGGFNAAQIHADRRFFRIAADQAVRIQRAVGRGGKRQGERGDQQRGECFFHIRLRFVRWITVRSKPRSGAAGGCGDCSMRPALFRQPENRLSDIFTTARAAVPARPAGRLRIRLGRDWRGVRGR